MWQRFSIRELEKLHPSSSSFQFGITMAIVAVIAAVITQLWWLLAVAASLVLVSFFLPQLLNGPNRIWFVIGLFMGWLMSPIFLALFYYLIFTPMAVVLKICGHKAFAKTGWVKKSKTCNFTRNF